MDDLHKAKEWLPAVIAAIAGGWAVIRIFFSFFRRVENNERDIAAFKEIANAKFEEIRDDIHAVSDRTDKRHDVIESKIDRLIERSIPR